MNKLSQKTGFLISLLILAAFLIEGCTYYGTPNRPKSMSESHLKVESPHPEFIAGINSILVLPIRTVGAVDPALERNLYSDLLDGLTQEMNVKLSSNEDAGASFLAAPLEALELKATELGKKAGSDGVIFGRLYDYMERSGSAYGGDAGASVSFSLHLVRVTDGREVWRGNFHRSDRPLSENLFRLGEVLKEGAAYRSASQLFKEGIVVAGRDLSSKHQESFVK